MHERSIPYRSPLIHGRALAVNTGAFTMKSTLFPNTSKFLILNLIKDVEPGV